MPVTKIRSGWSSGDLIFHESASVHPASGYNILTIGDDAVTVGDGSNDIDFKAFIGASSYVLFDYGNSRIDINGNTYLTPSASKLTFSKSIATANLGDGYGSWEVDVTLTGATAGHTAAASAWINLNGTVAAGGNLIAARSDGIYVNSGGSGDTTNALVAYGGRLQYVGDANPSKLCVFCVNVSGHTADGIFMTYNGNCATELGYVSDATSDGSKIGAVPLIVDAATGNQYWAWLYDSES